MALILELRDARGIVAWRRLDGASMTLGRALSNDVILDDPYADAVHARIVAGEDGALHIEDAGSVNGLRLPDGAAVTRRPLVAGVELRVGRTLLRVRDTSEPVAPALRDAPASVGVGRLLWSTRGRAAIIVAMLGVVAMQSWLTGTDRTSGMTIFGGVLAAIGIGAVWAAIWGVAARGPERRMNFTGHLAVYSLMLLAFVLYFALNAWLVFLFPDAPLLSVLDSVVMIGATAAVVATHLAIANVLTRRGRWRAGFVVAGSLAALILVGMLVDDDEEFSDVPAFQGRLKHMPLTMVPMQSVDEFLGAMREAKAEADEAASN